MPVFKDLRLEARVQRLPEIVQGQQSLEKFRENPCTQLITVGAATTPRNQETERLSQIAIKGTKIWELTLFFVCKRE